MLCEAERISVDARAGPDFAGGFYQGQDKEAKGAPGDKEVVEAVHYEVGQVPDLPFKWSFAGRSGTCPTLRIGAPQFLKQSGLSDYLDAQGCGFVEL